MNHLRVRTVHWRFTVIFLVDWKMMATAVGAYLLRLLIK